MKNNNFFLLLSLGFIPDFTLSFNANSKTKHKGYTITHYLAPPVLYYFALLQNSAFPAIQFRRTMILPRDITWRWQNTVEYLIYVFLFK
jgi:hypothetical protein